MSKARILLLVTCITGFASFQTLTASAHVSYKDTLVNDTSAVKNDTLCLGSFPSEGSANLEAVQFPDNPKKRKFVCALFALPFPFGFVGAHRVMLGAPPWIPVVYVATFGGCFGLLPLIDFCFITFSKDITQYENNPHIFMWAK